MNLVFDTDILSTFGKIRRLDLLRELFPNARFIVPPSVYDELFKARERGYEFIDYIIESGILEVTPLNEIKYTKVNLYIKGWERKKRCRPHGR